MFLAVITMSALCLALRPLLARRALDGPAFTSLFQGATRWQTFVALPLAANLYRRSRPCSGLGRDGGDDSAAQRLQCLGAGALRVAGTARWHDARDTGAQSVDLGLRRRACDQCPHLRCRALMRRRGHGPLVARARPAVWRGPSPRGLVAADLLPSLAVIEASDAGAGDRFALWFGDVGANLAIVRSAPRCRPPRTPISWRDRWAATRRCWRRS